MLRATGAIHPSRAATYRALRRAQGPVVISFITFWFAAAR